MQTERALRVASGLAAAIVTLSGCSTGSNSGDNAGDAGNVKFNAPPQMEQEYQQETQALKLPEGATWPPVVRESPAPDEKGVLRGHSYEPGYGVSLALSAWLCAWETEWLKQRGVNSKREKAALATLNGIKTMPNYTQYFDEQARALTDDILAKAAHGDPSPMAEDVKLNCTPSP